jgi:hypothetical protein
LSNGPDCQGRWRHERSEFFVFSVGGVIMKLIRKITVGLLFSAVICSNITYLYAQLPYKLVENRFSMSGISNNEYLQLQSLIKEVEGYLANPILQRMTSDKLINKIKEAKDLTDRSSKSEITKSISDLSYAIDQISNLKQQQIPSRVLEEVIPDKNLRKVIKNHITNEYITLNVLENINGELYASYENISSIEGIEILKNIESIILWKNNLTNIPKSILNLKKLKYIDLKNNYIISNDIIYKLESNKVNVEKDLNFIEGKPNQYTIKSKENVIVVNKGDNIDLIKYIYKDIQKYSKPWEVTNEININKFEANAENINIVNVNDMTIEGISKGNTKIHIKIKEINSPVLITLTVKVK